MTARSAKRMPRPYSSVRIFVTATEIPAVETVTAKENAEKVSWFSPTPCAPIAFVRYIEKRMAPTRMTSENPVSTTASRMIRLSCIRSPSPLFSLSAYAPCADAMLLH